MPDPDYRALCAELLAIIPASGTGNPNSLVVARARAALAQPEPVAAKLAWSKEREPCDECRYNHCIAETPFGRILISWKGWKGCPQITPDEVPWDDPWFPVWSDLEQAKAECEAEYNRRIAVSTNNIRGTH